VHWACCSILPTRVCVPAQILEVETFIPMLLQNFDVVEGCRLKRVILIGDHHQLPPVVKNMAFQKYGNFDQSLFTRYGATPDGPSPSTRGVVAPSVRPIASS
jgi:hypothetical protein